MNFARFLIAPFAAAALIAAAAPGDPYAADRIKADVAYLARDALNGRDTGSVGYALAADYVARQFSAIALTPGGTAGWYQTVPLRRATEAKPPTGSLLIDGKAIALRAGDDFGIRPSAVQQSVDIAAPLVFVGHGISDPRLYIDEYRGVDPRGKIVVAITGTPAGIPTDIAAHLSTTKDEVAAAKGAVAFIEIDPYDTRRGGSVSRANRQVMAWVDGLQAGGESVRLPVLALSPVWASRLFQNTPKSMEAIRSEARQRPLAAFDLPGRLSIHSESNWQNASSPNVIGILPGSDPKLSKEYVILMAHLDHLGIEPNSRPGEDRIFNGAMDNAAGVATMIEAARHFARTGHRPRRSLIFMAVTGEERGLLGADYFASRSTVPLDRIAGVVNLDMPLLLYDFSDVAALGGEHSTVLATISEASRSLGVKVSPDPKPEETLFVRSDHYRFVRHGVPSAFLMTGNANGGKAAWDYYLTRVYHRPNDDIRLPFNWGAAARFAELNYRIARMLADQPARPMWYRDSYFGAAFAPNQLKATR